MSTSYGGIYAETFVNKNNSLPSSVFSDPQVTGVALTLAWSDIEPEPGVYNWTYFDKEVKQAVAAGKEISITVEPNHMSAPSWLFQEGVPDLQFTVDTHGKMHTLNMAPPWNATYQQAYGQMMQALADNLKSIPGAYQAVSIVKITGMAEVSGETHLPSSSTTAGGVTDAIPIWQQQGYTPSKVIAAWEGFAASVNAAFPDKILAMESIADNAFPTINDQGKVVSTTSPSYVNVDAAIIAAGVALYGSRFAVQWDGLNASELAATVPEAEQLGAIGGYQTNKFGSDGGAGAGTNWRLHIPLTEAQFQQILDFGITQGAGQYIEVWPADIQKFASALAQADALMASSIQITSSTPATITKASSAEIIFSDKQGVLQLNQSTEFTGLISGFRKGDVMKLKDITFNDHTTLTFTEDSNKLGGTLSVTDGTYTAKIALLGQYVAADFQLAAAANGGTKITDDAHANGVLAAGHH